MYHKCSAQTLREHLTWIAPKYKPVHLRDVASYFREPSFEEYSLLQNSPDCLPRIILTFDDALHDFFLHAYPLLKGEFHFKASICVPTDYVSDSSQPERKLDNWENNEGSTNPTMTWDELQEISENPLFEIIPHSKSHGSPYFDRISEDQAKLKEQIDGSRAILMQKLCTESPTVFCLPGGAGEKFEETATINRVIGKHFVGALMASYKYERWNRFCIPRWNVPCPSSISDVLDQVPIP